MQSPAPDRVTAPAGWTTAAARPDPPSAKATVIMNGRSRGDVMPFHLAIGESRLIARGELPSASRVWLGSRILDGPLSPPQALAAAATALCPSGFGPAPGWLPMARWVARRDWNRGGLWPVQIFAAGPICGDRTPRLSAAPVDGKGACDDSA